MTSIHVGFSHWLRDLGLWSLSGTSSMGAEQTLERFCWHINAIKICGVLVYLLTALAQMEW